MVVCGVCPSAVPPVRTAAMASLIVYQKFEFDAAVRRRVANDATLAQLNLAVRLDGAMVAALADALQVNRTLAHLDVGLNRIGEAGARALADTLKINRTLAH